LCFYLTRHLGGACRHLKKIGIECNILFYFLAQICLCTEEEPLQDWYWKKTEIQILYTVVGSIYKTHKRLIRNQLNHCNVALFHV